MPKWSGHVIVTAFVVLAAAVWRLADSVYATRFMLVRTDAAYAYVLDGADGTVRAIALPVTADSATPPQ